MPGHRSCGGSQSSWLHCCTSRGEDFEEAAGRKGGERPRTALELAVLEERRSTEVLQRHASRLEGEPSVLLYSVAELPGHGQPNQQLRPLGRPIARPTALHVPANCPRAVPIETSGFRGEAVWMQVPGGAREAGAQQEAPADVPYGGHFAGKRRLWEFRLQGRFLKKPDGELFVGITLRDFNYNQAVAKYSHAVKRLGLLFIKWKFYLSWGDRCEASKEPDPELSHLVTGLAGFDQIVVTKAGDEPPALTEELDGLGLERKKLGYEKYKQEVSDLLESVNTDDVYTFCYWGPSPFIDTINWQFRFGTVIPMSQFLQEWPLHFVIYELKPPAEGQDKSCARHLETRKRYYLDLMFWSSTQDAVTKNMPSRYNFVDAPGDLESLAQSGAGAEAGPQEGGDGEDTDGPKQELQFAPRASALLMRLSGSARSAGEGGVDLVASAPAAPMKRRNAGSRGTWHGAPTMTLHYKTGGPPTCSDDSGVTTSTGREAGSLSDDDKAEAAAPARGWWASSFWA